MGKIRKLERARLVLPRLPTEGAGQGLEPIAVGAIGVSAVPLCLQGLWKKCVRQLLPGKFLK